MVQPTMALSNNIRYPAQKVPKKSHNFHGGWSTIGFWGWPDFRQSYVWHSSLQFWRDENSLSHIQQFLCDILHISDAVWAFELFGSVFTVRHIWFILIPGFKSIGKKNHCFKSSKVSPLSWFLRSVLKKWLAVLEPLLGFDQLPQNPQSCWSKIHICAHLADFCEKKEVCC